MKKTFWDVRYAFDAYAYGKKPNQFLKDVLLNEDILRRSILFPAEGEGRNAVFAAELGMDVFAFDFSVRGFEKANELAAKRNVKINYEVASFEQYQPKQSFDFIGLIFSHLPPKERVEMHHKYISWLKPGGKIILEAFSKDQLLYNSGGPKDEAMLYSTEDLSVDFKSMEIVHLEKTNGFLNEGTYHSGEANLVRMVAVKKG